MKALSRESRSLIDAARDGDEPSAVDRKRVRAGLARKLAVGAAAGAVAATASHAAAGGIVGGTSGAGAASAGAGVAAVGAAGSVTVAPAAVGGFFAASLGAKIVASIAIAGAVGAGTVGYVEHVSAERTARTTIQARTTPTERAVRRSPMVANDAPKPAASPLPVPAAEVAPQGPSSTPPEVALIAKAPVAMKTSTAPSAPPAPASPPASAAAASPAADLDAELALLQDVHGALRANDAPRALRLLDEHAHRFPNGALAEESEAARVFALCQLGRTDEARDLASRFLREHPRSLLAPRVSRACEAEPSTF